jgi:hypothetical protein
MNGGWRANGSRFGLSGIVLGRILGFGGRVRVLHQRADVRCGLKPFLSSWKSFGLVASAPKGLPRAE